MKFQKRFYYLLACLMAGPSGSVLGVFPPAGKEMQEKPQGVQFVILYSGNTNGYLTECECSRDPKGGLSRRKTVLDQLRAIHPNWILVDAGDVLSTYSKPESNQYLWQIYRLLNYTAINLGEDEFIDGWEAFKKYRDQFQLPFISANIVTKAGESIVRGVKFVTMNECKIGIVGLNDPERFGELDSTTQGQLEIISPDRKGFLEPILDFTWQRSDFIILLSHLGYEKSKELAKKYDVDVIIIGHGGSEMPEAEKVGEVLLVHPGSDGQNLGVLQIEWQDQQIKSYQNKLIPLGKAVPQDSMIQKIISATETISK